MIKILCSILLVSFTYISNTQCRSFNNGLIFYNLENHNSYLPPTISVSRGRSLSTFKYSSRGSIWSTFGKPCDCRGPLCGCCVGIQVKQYNFDQKMCANVTYARPKDEIQLEVFMNDTATAKYGIAARNPSPLCVPIMMGIPMSMCIQMSNIAVQGDNLNMCMDFLVRLASTELFEMHFQCMKVGLQGASWVGSDGQPVIPPSEAKIKDKTTNESEDYYDESEEEDQENKILSNEKDVENVATSMQEADLNKEEEEMSYNDITEKIMDLVKENEKKSSVQTDEFFKDGQMVHENKNMEEIVTNIMDSINKGNAAAEVSNSGLKGTQGSFIFVKDYGENLVTEENKKAADEFTAEDEVNHSKADVNNEVASGEKETQIENIAYNNQEPAKASNGIQEMGINNKNSELGVAPNQETTFGKISNIPGSATTQQLDTLINNTTNDVEQITEISKNDMKFNNPLETHHLTETSTGYLMVDNLKPTALQNAATTSEISNMNNINNSLTTAAIMTTTTTTTKATTTNIPTIKDKNSVMVITSNENPDEIDNEDDDQDESQENSDEDDDDDNDDDDDGAGDNSYENVSDYEDEESDELEDEITENENQLNNTSSAEFNNKNCIRHKASPSTKQNQANEADSNESLSDHKTNDVFATEIEEFEENANDEKDFGDYKTIVTTMETIGYNSTCCKPTIAPALNDLQINTTLQLNDNNYQTHIPQVDNALSNNLKFVSNSNNNMTGNNKLKNNMLNVEPTAYEALKVIAASTAATTGISSDSSDSNVRYQSLARKLFAFHHPLKQQRHHYATRPHHYYV